MNKDIINTSINVADSEDETDDTQLDEGCDSLME